MTRILTITAIILSLGLLYHYQNNVEVKYVDGPVKRSDYYCLPYVDSSSIEDACYDSATQKMLLKLKSTNYTFCNVPKSVWDEFIGSESMGGYFNKYIKGEYDC